MYWVFFVDLDLDLGAKRSDKLDRPDTGDRSVLHSELKSRVSELVSELSRRQERGRQQANDN